MQKSPSFGPSRRVVLLMYVAGSWLQAAAPNYEEHVRPIFENACFNCHNPDKLKGDLDLTSYSAAMRGGSGGKFAEPGEGGDSKIYGVITHTAEPKMPPKGDKLDKKDAELIRAWVDGGLLENKSAQPVKKKKPAFALSAAPSAGKPEGPPPLPVDVLLEPVVTSTRASVVADMAASPWAPLIAITGQRQVLLYHTDSLEMIGVLPFDYGQPEVLSFHPSGKYLLAGGGVGGKSGTTVTWEVETGKAVLQSGKDFDAVLAASLRSDLGGVSLGGPGKRVKLWDTAADQQQVSIKKHTDWVTQLAYSPDGVLLASGGRGGDVYVWEADTGNAFHVLRGHRAAITGMAWRSDSNLLVTVSEDGDMIIWEMNNGRQVKKQGAHQGGVLSVDWNHHGQIVTGGRDKKVRIWKPDFNRLKELPVFDEMVTEVAFSHDGKRVFAAGWSGNISVWDLAAAQQVGTLAANPPTIAARIESLREQIARFGAGLAEAQEAARNASANADAAKAKLVQVEQAHREANKKSKRMIAERSRLEGEIKAMNPTGDALNAERQQKQHDLTRARDELNKHNAEVGVARKAHQEVEREVRKLMDEQKRLVHNEQQARKAAEQKPDDTARSQAAAQAKARLDECRERLDAHRKRSEEKSAALALLAAQQQGPGDRLTKADKEWQGVNQRLKDYHGKRKMLNDQRNAMGKPISEQQKLARDLEKQIKPAREAHAKAEELQKRAQAGFEQVSNEQAGLEASVKHWQAAAINAEAIRLGAEAARLASKQNVDMDAFAALAAEVEGIKDSNRLASKSQQLGELRAAIDRTAYELLATSRKARDKKEAYLKACIE